MANVHALDPQPASAPRFADLDGLIRSLGARDAERNRLGLVGAHEWIHTAHTHYRDYGHGRSRTHAARALCNTAPQDQPMPMRPIAPGGYLEVGGADVGGGTAAPPVPRPAAVQYSMQDCQELAGGMAATHASGEAGSGTAAVAAAHMFDTGYVGASAPAPGGANVGDGDAARGALGGHDNTGNDNDNDVEGVRTHAGSIPSIGAVKGSIPTVKGTSTSTEDAAGEQGEGRQGTDAHRGQDQGDAQDYKRGGPRRQWGKHDLLLDEQALVHHGADGSFILRR